MVFPVGSIISGDRYIKVEFDSIYSPKVCFYFLSNLSYSTAFSTALPKSHILYLPSACTKFSGFKSKWHIPNRCNSFNDSHTCPTIFKIYFSVNLLLANSSSKVMVPNYSKIMPDFPYCGCEMIAEVRSFMEPRTWWFLRVYWIKVGVREFWLIFGTFMWVIWSGDGSVLRRRECRNLRLCISRHRRTLPMLILTVWWGICRRGWDAGCYRFCWECTPFFVIINKCSINLFQLMNVIWFKKIWYQLCVYFLPCFLGIGCNVVVDSAGKLVFWWFIIL